MIAPLVLAVFIVISLVWQRQPCKQRFTPRAAPAFYEPLANPSATMHHIEYFTPRAAPAFYEPLVNPTATLDKLEYFTPQAAPAVYEPLRPEDTQEDDATSLAGPDYDNNGKPRWTWFDVANRLYSMPYSEKKASFA